MKFKFFNVLILILLIQGGYALSSEAINASNAIKIASLDILEMQSRGISVIRVNESYQEALQLYSAQNALEKIGNNANYNLVIEYATSVGVVKENAFNAKDELEVFLETYNVVGKDIDLSGMNNTYNSILNAFNEERFEDVFDLIQLGYSKLSEIQSNNTALKLFYSTTSKSFKKFFLDNWIVIFSIILFGGIFSVIFRKGIVSWITKRKIHHLNAKKYGLDRLIKNLQYEYFKTKRISGLEYKTKLKIFENLILEINRQIPLLRAVNLKNPKRRRFSYKKKKVNSFISKKSNLKVSGSKVKKSKVSKKSKK